MSHIIYSTEALVLKAEDQGESNKLFWLFTEQFGLVVAHAQSVRSGHSKLKHELQLYNFTKVSLVRGREWWRIVNVAHSDLVVSNAGQGKKFLAEASDFLLRLIHGEGVHADIFADLSRAEILPFKVRALVSLGYLSPVQIGADSFIDEEKLADLIEIGFAHSQL